MKLKEYALTTSLDTIEAEYEIEDCNRCIQALTDVGQTLCLEDQLEDAFTEGNLDRIHLLASCMYAIKQLKILSQDRRSWASNYLGGTK